jgi:AAA+ superfamily predicted ATPase
MQISQLIIDSLALPTPAIAYHVSQNLTTLYPDKTILEGSECSFNLQAYARENLCTIEQVDFIHNQITTGWDGMHHKIYKDAENAWLKVTWHEYQFDVLIMSWKESEWSKINYYWILADSKQIAEQFFGAVCYWNGQIQDDVLVFEDGHWSKNHDLFESIKSATFDNLILPGNLKQEIQDDLKNFFASRETYADYGVPWKRGILFIGSPGNGKTHAVKALINKMQQPCLYVKSFKHRYIDDSENICKVFQKARQSAPCILILEDIDSLLTDENRSFFLNELDGFAANEGIITIGTTNHPDKLDTAILERPSRFDRKYHFELPSISERKAYIALWSNKLKPEMRLSDEASHQIVELTEGFSFAYLKELLFSSMTRWMAQMEAGGMEKIMLSQLTVLREQMSSTKQESESKEAGKDSPEDLVQLLA